MKFTKKEDSDRLNTKMIERDSDGTDETENIRKDIFTFQGLHDVENFKTRYLVIKRP